MVETVDLESTQILDCRRLQVFEKQGIVYPFVEGVAVGGVVVEGMAVDRTKMLRAWWAVEAEKEGH